MSLHVTSLLHTLSYSPGLPLPHLMSNVYRALFIKNLLYKIFRRYLHHSLALFDLPVVISYSLLIRKLFCIIVITLKVKVANVTSYPWGVKVV